MSFESDDAEWGGHGYFWSDLVHWAPLHPGTAVVGLGY